MMTQPRLTRGNAEAMGRMAAHLSISPVSLTHMLVALEYSHKSSIVGYAVTALVREREIMNRPIVEAICDRWVARFGGGFHPDTRGSDYVDRQGFRVLIDVEAVEYDRDMSELCRTSRDPYEDAVNAMRRAGVA